MISISRGSSLHTPALPGVRQSRAASWHTSRHLTVSPLPRLSLAPATTASFGGPLYAAVKKAFTAADVNTFTPVQFAQAPPATRVQPVQTSISPLRRRFSLRLSTWRRVVVTSLPSTWQDLKLAWLQLSAPGPYARPSPSPGTSLAGPGPSPTCVCALRSLPPARSRASHSPGNNRLARRSATIGLELLGARHELAASASHGAGGFVGLFGADSAWARAPANLSLVNPTSRLELLLL